VSDRFTATYLIETAHPLQEAAEIMAGEQSAGTFVRVPGESDALRERYGARVEHIEPLDECRCRRCRARGRPRGRRRRVTGRPK
jgi:ribulose-bisphosphate carboxylase large chain